MMIHRILSRGGNLTRRIKKDIIAMLESRPVERGVFFGSSKDPIVSLQNAKEEHWNKLSRIFNTDIFC